MPYRVSSRRLASFLVASILLFAAPAAPTFAQLRVASWNVSNYSSGRINEFQTAIYGVFEGRSLSPDLLIGQEFLTASAVNNFRNLLNTAPGSPGDWAAAPFRDGPDTDNAFFYRTSKVDFLGVTTVAFGGPAPNHPRNVERYDVRLKGYAAPGAVLACYSTHMKASDGGANEARRLLEAQRIRADARGLPEGWHYVLGGDTNIHRSTEPAFVELTAAQAGSGGQFVDPIKTPGSWHTTPAFRIVHTQDPANSAGMDDRFDFILISTGLVDTAGFDYVGDATQTYSTSTWNDPHHSYRAWGNDGTSYDQMLTIAGNTMVGATVAQALVSSAAGQGHLPILLDLRVPPKLAAPTVLNFGTVTQGSTAEMTITVTNAADAALWSADGIADLTYTLSAGEGFTAPSGEFIESAGGTGREHVMAMATTQPGEVSGTLTITSNAPDTPIHLVQLVGVVTPGVCPGDHDCDGDVDLADFAAFAACYGLPVGSAGFTAPTANCLNVFDFDTDGDVDLADASIFQSMFTTTEP